MKGVPPPEIDYSQYVIAPMPEPPKEAPSRGILGDLANTLIRIPTVAMPEHFGRAIEDFAPETGKSLVDYSKRMEERFPLSKEAEGTVRGDVLGGVESTGPSAGVPLLGAGLGAAAGLLLGGPPGALAGAKVGGGIGAALTIPSFYTAEKNRFLAQAETEAVARGEDPGVARERANNWAHVSGLIEGGGELVGDVAAYMTLGLGKTFFKAMKPGARTLAKILHPALLTGLADVPFEAGTEALQGMGEAYARGQAGLEAGDMGREAMSGAIGGATMALMFGGIGHGYHLVKQKAITDTLSNSVPAEFTGINAEKAMKTRETMVNLVSDQLAKDEDTADIADLWKQYASQQVQLNKPVDMNQELDKTALEISLGMTDAATTIGVNADDFAESTQLAKNAWNKVKTEQALLDPMGVGAYRADQGPGFMTGRPPSTQALAIPEAPQIDVNQAIPLLSNTSKIREGKDKLKQAETDNVALAMKLAANKIRSKIGYTAAMKIFDTVGIPMPGQKGAPVFNTKEEAEAYKASGLPPIPMQAQTVMQQIGEAVNKGWDIAPILLDAYVAQGGKIPEKMQSVYDKAVAKTQLAGEGKVIGEQKGTATNLVLKAHEKERYDGLVKTAPALWSANDRAFFNRYTSENGPAAAQKGLTVVKGTAPREKITFGKKEEEPKAKTTTVVAPAKAAVTPAKVVAGEKVRMTPEELKAWRSAHAKQMSVDRAAKKAAGIVTPTVAPAKAPEKAKAPVIVAPAKAKEKEKAKEKAPEKAKEKAKAPEKASVVYIPREKKTEPEKAKGKEPEKAKVNKKASDKQKELVDKYIGKIYDKKQKAYAQAYDAWIMSDVKSDPPKAEGVDIIKAVRVRDFIHTTRHVKTFKSLDKATGKMIDKPIQKGVANAKKGVTPAPTPKEEEKPAGTKPAKFQQGDKVVYTNSKGQTAKGTVNSVTKDGRVSVTFAGDIEKLISPTKLKKQRGPTVIKTTEDEKARAKKKNEARKAKPEELERIEVNKKNIKDLKKQERVDAKGVALDLKIGDTIVTYTMPDGSLKHTVISKEDAEIIEAKKTARGTATVEYDDFVEEVLGKPKPSYAKVEPGSPEWDRLFEKNKNDRVEMSAYRTIVQGRMTSKAVFDRIKYLYTQTKGEVDLKYLKEVINDDNVEAISNDLALVEVVWLGHTSHRASLIESYTEGAGVTYVPKGKKAETIAEGEEVVEAEAGGDVVLKEGGLDWKTAKPSPMGDERDAILESFLRKWKPTQLEHGTKLFQAKEEKVPTKEKYEAAQKRFAEREVRELHHHIFPGIAFVNYEKAGGEVDIFATATAEKKKSGPVRTISETGELSLLEPGEKPMFAEGVEAEEGWGEGSKLEIVEEAEGRKWQPSMKNLIKYMMGFDSFEEFAADFYGPLGIPQKLVDVNVELRNLLTKLNPRGELRKYRETQQAYSEKTTKKKNKGKSYGLLVMDPAMELEDLEGFPPTWFNTRTMPLIRMSELENKFRAAHKKGIERLERMATKEAPKGKELSLEEYYGHLFGPDPLLHTEGLSPEEALAEIKERIKERAQIYYGKERLQRLESKLQDVLRNLTNEFKSSILVGTRKLSDEDWSIVKAERRVQEKEEAKKTGIVVVRKDDSAFVKSEKISKKDAELIAEIRAWDMFRFMYKISSIGMKDFEQEFPGLNGTAPETLTEAMGDLLSDDTVVMGKDSSRLLRLWEEHQMLYTASQAMPRAFVEKKDYSPFRIQPKELIPPGVRALWDMAHSEGTMDQVATMMQKEANAIEIDMEWDKGAEAEKKPKPLPSEIRKKTQALKDRLTFARSIKNQPLGTGVWRNLPYPMGESELIGNAWARVEPEKERLARQELKAYMDFREAYQHVKLHLGVAQMPGKQIAPNAWKATEEEIVRYGMTTGMQPFAELSPKEKKEMAKAQAAPKTVSAATMKEWQRVDISRFGVEPGTITVAYPEFQAKKIPIERPSQPVTPTSTTEFRAKDYIERATSRIDIPQSKGLELFGGVIMKSPGNKMMLLTHEPGYAEGSFKIVPIEFADPADVVLLNLGAPYGNRAEKVGQREQVVFQYAQNPKTFGVNRPMFIVVHSLAEVAERGGASDISYNPEIHDVINEGEMIEALGRMAMEPTLQTVYAPSGRENQLRRESGESPLKDIYTRPTLNKALFVGDAMVASTQNVDPRIAGLFAEFNRLLGMDAKIRVIGMREARDTMDALPFEVRDEINKDGFYASQVMVEGEHFVIVSDDLLNRLKVNEPVAYGILTHEYGHIIFDQAFEKAPQKTKDAILESFAAWFDKVENMTWGEFKKEISDPFRRYLVANLPKERAGLSDNELARDVVGSEKWAEVTRREEWFADQVVKWATTTEKPMSIVDKFFKGVADMIRKFVDMLKQNYGFGVTADVSVVNFLDGMRASRGERNTNQSRTANEVLDLTDPKAEIAQLRKRAVPHHAMTVEQLTSNDINNAPNHKDFWNNFKGLINKNLIKLRPQDIGFIQTTFSNPFWLGQKYIDLAEAVKIQQKRDESRIELIHKFLRKVEGFNNLKGESLKRVERVLIEGDRELSEKLITLMREKKKDEVEALLKLNRYSDEELKSRFKLSPEEIAAYIEVRSALDELHVRWQDQVKQRVYQFYKGKKWFGALSVMLGETPDAEAERFWREKVGPTWNAMQDALSAAKVPLEELLKTPKELKRIDEGTLSILNNAITRVIENKDLTEEEAQRIIERAINRSTKLLAKKKPAELAVLTANMVKEYMKQYKKAKKNIEEIREHLRKIYAAQGEVVVDDLLLNEDIRDMIAAWGKTKPRLQELRKIRNQLKHAVAYFPRERDDNKLHYIAVWDKVWNEEKKQFDKGRMIYINYYNIGMIGGKKIKAVIQEKINAMGKNADDFFIDDEPNVKQADATFFKISDQNTARIINNALEGLTFGDKISQDNKEKINDLLKQAIADEMNARGFGKHRLRRTMGFDEDNKLRAILGYKESGLQNVLLNYLTGYAGLETKSTASFEFNELLDGIDKKKPGIWNYIKSYMEDQLRNQERIDKVNGVLRTAMFAWYLGASLKAPFVQLTQNFVTGIPFLAQAMRKKYKGSKSDKTKPSFMEAERVYFKAMKDIATGNMKDDEVKFLQQLLDNGVALDQYIQDATGRITQSMSGKYEKSVRFLSTWFSKAEIYNRKSAGLAMYRFMKEQGEDWQLGAKSTAGEIATQFIYKTHYLMGKANLPDAMRGAGVLPQALRGLYTFRSFTHNYMLSMIYGDISGLEKARTALHSLAYLALLGGLLSLPFLKDLFDWWEREKGEDILGDARQKLRKFGGPTFEKLGVYGIVGLALGDISGSLSFGVPFMGTSTDTVYGAVGGMGKKAAKAYEARKKGDYYRAVENLMPEFVANPLRAMRMSEFGQETFGTPGYATTPSGHALIGSDGKPVRMRGSDIPLKAIGFQPTDYSQSMEEDRGTKSIEKYFENKRTNINERYRIARSKGDQSGVKDAMDRMSAFNKERIEKGVTGIVSPLKMSQLVKNAKMGTTRKERKEAAFKQMNY